MLAADRSNQAIAGQLVVTLDTVKKHVSHILGKLGAANRTEAVTRARAGLGLALAVIATAQLMVVLEVSATVFNCATSMIPGCVFAAQTA